ncbi:hypothetical protein [Vibrio phage BONAISHI]|nr:hypothetical protein [Vibrio phage BONAISHI]
MSNWNNNYGRGGKSFQPAERPVLDPEHELQAIAEAAIKDKGDLRRYSVRGKDPITQTTVLNSDPSRKSIVIAQAALMVHSQCGISPENSRFPAVGKFDTRYDDNQHFIMYEGPIPWHHDSNWIHIPCWTRYVISRCGQVLNANNGMAVKPNEWGMYELVPDGPSNKLKKVTGKELMRMAFVPLPEDFRDYGMRMYSHVWDVDPEKGIECWIPLPPVMCKTDNGVEEFRNIREAVKCLVEKFNSKKQWNDYTWKGKLDGQTVNIDGITAKEKTPPAEKLPIPTIAATPAGTQETNSAPQQTEAAPAEADFDEDFSF